MKKGELIFAIHAFCLSFYLSKSQNLILKFRIKWNKQFLTHGFSTSRFFTLYMYERSSHLDVMFTYITCRVFKSCEEFYSRVINFRFFYNREKCEIKGPRM